MTPRQSPFLSPILSLKASPCESTEHVPTLGDMSAIGRDKAKRLLRKAGLNPYSDYARLRRLAKRSRTQAQREIDAERRADSG